MLFKEKKKKKDPQQQNPMIFNRLFCSSKNNNLKLATIQVVFHWRTIEILF